MKISKVSCVFEISFRLERYDQISRRKYSERLRRFETRPTLRYIGDAVCDTSYRRYRIDQRAMAKRRTLIAIKFNALRSTSASADNDASLSLILYTFNPVRT